MAEHDPEIFNQDEMSVLSEFKDKYESLQVDDIPFLLYQNRVWAETLLYEVISYRQALEPV